MWEHWLEILIIPAFVVFVIYIVGKNFNIWDKVFNLFHGRSLPRFEGLVNWIDGWRYK